MRFSPWHCRDILTGRQGQCLFSRTLTKPLEPGFCHCLGQRQASLLLCFLRPWLLTSVFPLLLSLLVKGAGREGARKESQWPAKPVQEETGPTRHKVPWHSSWPIWSIGQEIG